VRACLNGRIPYANVSANAQAEIAARRGLRFAGDVATLDERHRVMVDGTAAEASAPHLANSDPLRAYSLLTFGLAQDAKALIERHPTSPLVLAWCIESGKCAERLPALRALAITEREFVLSTPAVSNAM
jgi:hypothetical protein